MSGVFEVSSGCRRLKFAGRLSAKDFTVESVFLACDRYSRNVEFFRSEFCHSDRTERSTGYWCNRRCELFDAVLSSFSGTVEMLNDKRVFQSRFANAFLGLIAGT